MFKQFLLVVVVASLALAGSSQVYCHDDLGPGVAAGSLSVQLRRDKTRAEENLFDEIVNWLSSNFDLPAIKDRPNIAIRLKYKTSNDPRCGPCALAGFTKDEGGDQLAQRRVVALYDNNSKTIFLPNNWIGTSPTDQSVLVHEMVHHLQNLAKLKFECPMAREKVAYMAQDKWLGRFGTSLEKEFDVDMFTVLISSACMY